MACFSIGNASRRFFLSVSNTQTISRCSVAANKILLTSHISTNIVRSKGQSLLLLTAAGVGAGALLGGGYSLYFRNTRSMPVLNEVTESVNHILDRHPDVNISRRVFNSEDTSGLQLTLFQYPTCPFCCKVRAFLNFHGLTYDVVEVNPVLRQQIRWSDYKKVPILLAKVDNGYQQLNDSSMIISALSTYLQETNTNLKEVVNFYPKMSYRDDNGALKSEILNRYFVMHQNTYTGRSKEDMEEERKWRAWADNVLVHTLSPNVYRTREEALQAFQWFSEVGEWDRLFPSWERGMIVYVGALAMLYIGKMLKKRHNLKDDVRQSLYDECNHWMRAINKKGSTFMGGREPNLADLAVYGVLSSIEGCSAFEDLLNNTKIAKWYWPIKKIIESNSGIVISS